MKFRMIVHEPFFPGRVAAHWAYHSSLMHQFMNFESFNVLGLKITSLTFEYSCVICIMPSYVVCDICYVCTEVAFVEYLGVFAQ